MQGEKDTHPKIAKTSQVILVSVMTALSDENANSGNIVTGLGATILSTKLLHGNLQSGNHGKMSILVHKEVELLQFNFEHHEQHYNR